MTGGSGVRAELFVRDLANRVTSERVQITTDGLGTYFEPIKRYFENRADYGSETKDYGILDDETPERKYSPMVVKKVIRVPLYGVPDPDYISTAYVNLHVFVRDALPSSVRVTHQNDLHRCHKLRKEEASADHPSGESATAPTELVATGCLLACKRPEPTARQLQKRPFKGYGHGFSSFHPPAGRARSNLAH